MSNAIDDETLYEYLGDLVTRDSPDRELALISAAAQTTARREMRDLLPYLTKVRDSL
ncbi:hypothetical protein [Mycolicibacterium llatzerense]|uniref:hypothetical protein n=1 Tax=Mycolicibacterium llatzerense TaxID=280871 RepID=UPI0013A6FEB3|nr:hypothetical protein [Mycolicibacterium llatzerense]